jgi:hypothetical protein
MTIGHLPDIRSSCLTRQRFCGSAAVIILLTLTSAEPAGAASTGFQPFITTAIQYESNPNYRQDGRENSATGLVMETELNAYSETKRTRWTFEPSFRLSNYSGSENDNLDGDDFRLPFSGTYSTARTAAGVSGQYSQSTTRYGELEQAIPDDPDNPGSPGSGRVNRIDDDQVYKSIGPYLRFNLSPTDSLTFSTNYSETSYDQAAVTRQPGYENLGTQATFQRLFNPKNFAFASVNGTFFKSEQPCGAITSFADTCGIVFVPGQIGTDITNDTDTFGINFGYEFARTPTESLSISAGTARSDFAIRNLRSIENLPCFDSAQQTLTPCRFEGSETNFIGEVSYSVRSESTTSTASISRSLQPNSDGATVTQDNLQAFLIREVSPRIQVRAGITLLKSEFVGGSRNGELRERFKRDYWRIAIGGSWRLTKRLSIRGGYDFLDNDYGDSSSSAKNNIFTLGLQYTGQERRGLPW